MGKNHENAEKSRPLISLRTIFGVLFFLLMIGTILLSFLVNTLFLERYQTGQYEPSGHGFQHQHAQGLVGG